MSPDQPEIKTIRENIPPSIRTVLTSDGIAFWNDLDPEILAVQQPHLRRVETMLVSTLPADYISPQVLKARQLGLEKAYQTQNDHESCTYFSVANAFRCLSGPNPTYSREIIKTYLERVLGRTCSDELNYNQLAQLLHSTSPFNRFQVFQIDQSDDDTFPFAMLGLLQKFAEGCVAVSGWAYSPDRTLTKGVQVSHARTMTGFSINDRRLYFHVIDPYEVVEKPWSFRDFVIANYHSFAYLPDFNLRKPIPIKYIDAMARGAWVLEKVAA